VNAHFRVAGRFDQARPQEATVTVERATQLFSVRPLRRRRTYTLPLATVAEIVTARIIKAELAERRAARKRGRR
jgi:hypothetical protein